MVQSGLYLFFGQIQPRCTRVCLLCLTFNRFLSFFSQSEALHSSTLCSPNECQRTRTLHTPHYVIRATHVSTYCPHTSPRYRGTTYGYQFAPWPQTAVVCRIQNRGMLDLCYDTGNSCRRERSRQILRVLLVWRGVCCGGWRGSPRASTFV